MLKILCLHGYRQNGLSFKDKTGSLRKVLRKHAELVYISAPHLLPSSRQCEDVGQNNVHEEQRAWYFSTEELTFNSHDVTEFSCGLDDSVALIQKTLRESGPFDGLLGFSQGAAMVSIICQLVEHKKLEASFKFAILVSGFRSRLKPHACYYENINSIPSLHIIGESDRIVEKEMCNDLSGCFESAEVAYHEGGHYVPASAKEKEHYIKFLSKFQPC